MRLPADTPDAAREALANETRRLAGQFGVDSALFERGFLEGFSCRAVDLAVYPQLLARPMRWLQLIGLGDDHANELLASSTAVRWLEELRLLFVGGMCRRLAAIPDLRLRRLALHRVHLDDAELAAIAAAPWCARLEQLRFGTSLARPAGVAALFARLVENGEPALRELAMFGTDRFASAPTGAQAEMLAALSRCRLRALELRHVEIRAAWLTLPASLERLALDSVLDWDAATGLASHPFTALSRLRVVVDSAPALVALLAAPWSSRLTDLSLAGSPIADAGVAALVNAPMFRTIERLDLDGCAITERGARELVAAAHFAKRLEVLRLGGNRLEPDVLDRVRDAYGAIVEVSQPPTPPPTTSGWQAFPSIA